MQGISEETNLHNQTSSNSPQINYNKINTQKMQVVKSIRISLTMGDIVQNLPQLSKQQIIQKFRILLDRKQIEINDKIQKNNADHLLILQKKMLILERKDQQIVKLNNALSLIRNQLNEEKMKNNDLTDQAIESKMRALHFQKKFNQYDNIFKEEKAKREKLKKQHEKLLNDYKILSEDNSKQMRSHRKVKQQKVNWQEQTELLLNNLKKTHEKQFAQKTKNIKLEQQQQISQLQQNLHEQQQKSNNYRQKYEQSKTAYQKLSKTVDSLNKQLANQRKKQKKIVKKIIQNQVQTCQKLLEDAYWTGELFRREFYQEVRGRAQGEVLVREKSKVPDKRNEEIQVSIQIECQSCTQLKNMIQNLETQMKKSKPKQVKTVQKPIETTTQSSQTNPPPKKILNENSCQTIFNPLSREQEEQLFSAFKIIKRTSEGLINSQKRRYEKMQQLFLSRPSKTEDKQTISELERKIVTQELQLVKKQKQKQNVSFVITQLQHKINEQAALLNQFNIDEVEITPSSTKIDKRSNSIDVNTSFCMANRKNLARSQTKDKVSLTISVREMMGSKITKINRNSTGSFSYLNTKAAQESLENLQAEKQQSKSLNVSRGINFKKKGKQDWREQISELRHYKKYRCSWKKVRL